MMATIYVLSSILVGLLAIGRRGGFLFYFAVSIIGSPILGLILLVLATEVVDREDPRGRGNRSRGSDRCRGDSRDADVCRADRT
jgi:hypothetical protein